MPTPVVVAESLVKCSFGVAPAPLQVLPDALVLSDELPVATITCCEIINIETFAMCMSLSNPEVAAATSAALGVLTPMPCVPLLTPWTPESPVLIGGQPALVATATCMCAYGGVIDILPSGAETTLA
jgi:hypothetical protein